MNARSRVVRCAIAGLLVAAGAAFVFGNQPVPGTRITGSARLVAFERIPGIESGDQCTWETATLQDSFSPPAYQAAGAVRQSAEEFGTEARRAEVAARKPLRVIHDPYAGFSTVWVDAARNEVVLGDEYNFNLHVYDRLANTPSSAAKTEPKRVVGGLATNSQFVSSVYVDPNNGEIYAINNDSLRGLNIFGRQAQGDVKPDRTILSPYGSFGLTVDEARQELLLTIQHNSAILVYPKNARGDAEPIRLIQGDRTHMADPHSIAMDAKNRLLYVVNYGTSHRAVQGTVGATPGSPRRVFWPAGNNLGNYRK